MYPRKRKSLKVTENVYKCFFYKEFISYTGIALFIQPECTSMYFVVCIYIWVVRYEYYTVKFNFSHLIFISHPSMKIKSVSIYNY